MPLNSETFKYNCINKSYYSASAKIDSHETVSYPRPNEYVPLILTQYYKLQQLRQIKYLRNRIQVTFKDPFHEYKNNYFKNIPDNLSFDIRLVTISWKLKYYIRSVIELRLFN